MDLCFQVLISESWLKVFIRVCLLSKTFRWNWFQVITCNVLQNVVLPNVMTPLIISWGWWCTALCHINDLIHIKFSSVPWYYSSTNDLPVICLVIYKLSSKPSNFQVSTKSIVWSWPRPVCRSIPCRCWRPQLKNPCLSRLWSSSQLHRLSMDCIWSSGTGSYEAIKDTRPGLFSKSAWRHQI